MGKDSAAGWSWAGHSTRWEQLMKKVCESDFPVAQVVEHGASNAKIMGSIPRESKS